MSPRPQLSTPFLMGSLAPLLLFIAFIEPGLSLNDVYSVGGFTSYTWTNGYPQSCSCQESGVTLSACSLFKCSCTCDLTAGVCDYNCCCDPDCSADQISRFQSLDVCSYEGHEPDIIQYCYATDSLEAVNSHSSLSGESTASSAVGRALCVEKTNYAFKEDFYVDIGQQSSQIFAQSAGQKSYSYTDGSTVQQSTLAADSFFDQNDTIAAFYNSSLTYSLVAADFGYLIIPAADASTRCNDANFAKFSNDVALAENECDREVALTVSSADQSTAVNEFTSFCEEQQSTARFAQNLWIAKTANTVAATGVIGFADVLRVELSEVLFSDGTASVDITNTWNSSSCATTAVLVDSQFNASLTAGNPCVFSNVTSTSAESLIGTNGSILVCQNVIQSVKYSISHDATASGTITSISAQVVLQDLAVSITDAMAANATTPVVARWKQWFGIEFVSGDTSQRSTANGNLVQRIRSGNPGYVMGRPVLFANSNGSTMAELVEGMQVPTSAVGQCPSSSSELRTTSAIFGFDSLDGCLLELSRQELKDICCTGASGSCLDYAQDSTLSNSVYSQASNGLPYFLNISQGYIGSYGDADPLDPTQWFALTKSIPTDARQWNDKTSTCSNMLSGINIQFLVTYTGERSNPQNKIVAALAEVVTSDWTLAIPAMDKTSKQAFPLTITTSYVFKNEQDIVGYVPPAPPSLFKVPYDVFYPFESSAATSSSARVSLLSCSLILIGLLALFL